MVSAGTGVPPEPPGTMLPVLYSPRELPAAFPGNSLAPFPVAPHRPRRACACRRQSHRNSPLRASPARLRRPARRPFPTRCVVAAACAVALRGFWARRRQKECVSWRARLIFWSAIQRQPDIKRRSLAYFGFKRQGTAVLFHHKSPRQCQALPCTFANFFRRKERIENFVAHRFGNSCSAVCDCNFDPILVLARSHLDFSLILCAFDHIAYRVCRVYQQIQKHLIQVS